MKNALNWIGIISLPASLAGLAWVILGQLAVTDTAKPGAFDFLFLPSLGLGIVALVLLAATRTRAA